jgi:hypothetical protein
MAVLSILEQLGMLEEITADLYPYRFIITPIVIAALIGAGYAAYRLGVHNVLLHHRLATTLIGVPALVIALLVGDYLISPLWERSRLDEASPIAVAEAANAPGASGGSQGQSATGSTSGFEAKVVQSGEFVGADDFHFGRGDAQLIQTGPNTYVLRFENFSVRNGPDLFVYLSEDPSGKTISESLNLGKLKATDGAFNYEVPASVDASKIKSAVVWCKQFAVLFTHAAFM